MLRLGLRQHKMGSRANGAVVCGGITTVYYSHYAADSVVEHILAGPECVLRSIDFWEEKSSKILMDDIWAEAAVVINLDSKSAAFLDSRLGRNALLLRKYQRHAENVFVDFNLQWLYCGMRDFARLAGLQPTFEQQLKKLNGPDLVQKYGQWT